MSAVRWLSSIAKNISAVRMSLMCGGMLLACVAVIGTTTIKLNTGDKSLSALTDVQYISDPDITQPVHKDALGMSADRSLDFHSHEAHAFADVKGTSTVSVAAAPDIAATGKQAKIQRASGFQFMQMHKPLMLVRVSSLFGKRTDPFGHSRLFHRGIDLAAPAGTPVFAMAAGTVAKSTTEHDYGKVIVIDHHNGFTTLYAHNSQLLVKVGDQVRAGQQVAKVGATGHATGPHLHFEIQRSGKRVDPTAYLARL